MAICSWFMDADTGAVQRHSYLYLSMYVNKTIETGVMNRCLENIQFVVMVWGAVSASGITGL